jgi:predicted Zn-ribbon and HTH transcriptional regulator
MKNEGMFKVVVTGGIYSHNHRSHGQDTLTLQGVECPRCGHRFVPRPVTEPPKCPECSFEERKDSAV